MLPETKQKQLVLVHGNKQQWPGPPVWSIRQRHMLLNFINLGPVCSAPDLKHGQRRACHADRGYSSEYAGQPRRKGQSKKRPL